MVPPCPGEIIFERGVKGASECGVELCLPGHRACGGIGRGRGIYQRPLVRSGLTSGCYQTVGGQRCRNTYLARDSGVGREEEHQVVGLLDGEPRRI